MYMILPKRMFVTQNLNVPISEYHLHELTMYGTEYLNTQIWKVRRLCEMEQ